MTDFSQHIAEADRIKQRLDECKTAAEVEQVANDERDNVRALAKIPDAKVLAIQIANLKLYKLNMLGK